MINSKLNSRSLLSCHSKVSVKRAITRDFPGGAVVKSPPANAGDMGSSPGMGRSHMRGAAKPGRHNY